jgi:hypothetical protein
VDREEGGEGAAVPRHEQAIEAGLDGRIVVNFHDKAGKQLE